MTVWRLVDPPKPAGMRREPWAGMLVGLAAQARSNLARSMLKAEIQAVIIGLIKFITDIYRTEQGEREKIRT